MMIKPITEYRVKRKYSMDKRLKKVKLADAYAGNAIYAVSEAVSNCIKVGMSKQLHKRLDTYIVSSPAEIRLEAAAFITDFSKLSLVEAEIHKRLRALGAHVRGEWYRVDLNRLRQIVRESCDVWGAVIEREIGSFLTRDGDNPNDGNRFPDFQKNHRLRKGRNPPLW